MKASKSIDFVLRYYNNIKRAVNEKRLDPNTPHSGGGGHARISDPTAIKAIRNTEELAAVEVFFGAAVNGKTESMTLHRPESWLRVIDLAKAHFAGQVHWSIITMKYNENLSREEIVKRLNIGRTLYHVALNDVFVFAEGVAAGLKLVPAGMPRRA